MDSGLSVWGWAELKLYLLLSDPGLAVTFNSHNVAWRVSELRGKRLGAV